jgi:hypothetical protein
MVGIFSFVVDSGHSYGHEVRLHCGFEFVILSDVEHISTCSLPFLYLKEMYSQVLCSVFKHAFVLLLLLSCWNILYGLDINLLSAI